MGGIGDLIIPSKVAIDVYSQVLHLLYKFQRCVVDVVTVGWRSPLVGDIQNFTFRGVEG